MSVSPRTLTRMFQEELGVSPGRWLLTRRLGRARALLEAGDGTIESVASRTGLSSAGHLRLRFLSELQTTPGAYRRTFAVSLRRPAPHSQPVHN